MKQLFKQLIVDFTEQQLPEINFRQVRLPLNPKRIVSIIGARRVGKTFLLFNAIKKLRQQQSPDRVIYINFDDDRLYPFSSRHLSTFIDAYYELFPDNRQHTVYFFFDEIQNIPGWDLFLRRIYDTLNCKIYITGSSSKLLSRELATALRGRTVTYEVFPLSFYEYVTWNGIEYKPYSSAIKSKLINLFDKYLKSSSYPEMFDMEQTERTLALKEIYDLLIYKDLSDRYNIKNKAAIKYLLKFLLTNAGNYASINRISNDLKSQGFNISKDTIHLYLNYLEDAFIMFYNYIFSENIRVRNRNPRKIYALDQGLINLVSIKLNSDRLLENFVFMHLRRKYYDIHYFKDNNYEIDFIVLDENKNYCLINVAYDIANPTTLNREVKALVNGMKHFSVKHSYLITYETEREISTETGKIFVLPAWKWAIHLYK